MENRHYYDERYKEGVVHIDPEFIKKASESNLLELITREKTEAVLGGDFNIYIEIKGTNYVLMHIKKNQYIVINRRIWCKKTKKWIHLAKRLANGFHFKLNNGEVTTQPRVKHKCKKKTMYIYRIIMSYSLYGCVDGLDSAKDVHHVNERYYNMHNCLRYVDRDVHLNYHFDTGNKSKRDGKIIKNYKEFCDFLNEIKRVDKMASIMQL